MVRNDVLDAVEPPGREAREHLALAWDAGRQDDVEGRDPVGGHDQEVVAQVEGVANLAARKPIGKVGSRRISDTVSLLEVYWAASSREVTPRREITSLTCHFAPARLMPSALAISGFVRPAATSRNTCCCRGVSLLDGVVLGLCGRSHPKT